MVEGVESDGFIMQEKNPREILENYFGVKDRMILNQAAFDGYRFANKWLNDDLNKFLAPYLKEVRGRAINWCIDDCIRQAVKLGALDMTITEELTKGKQFKYLVLNNKKKTIQLTVHQVAKRENIARKAKNRNSRITAFQSYWDFPSPATNEPELITEKPLYFQLTHGYQSNFPNFVVLGIPNEMNRWEDGSIDISKEAQIISNQKEMATTPIEFKSPKIEDFMDLLSEEES